MNSWGGRGKHAKHVPLGGSGGMLTVAEGYNNNNNNNNFERHTKFRCTGSRSNGIS